MWNKTRCVLTLSIIVTTLALRSGKVRGEEAAATEKTQTHWYAGKISVGVAKDDKLPVPEHSGVVVSVIRNETDKQQAKTHRASYESRVYLIPEHLADKLIEARRIDLTQKDLSKIATTPNEIFHSFAPYELSNEWRLIFPPIERGSPARALETKTRYWWGGLFSPAFALWASNEEEVEVPMGRLFVPHRRVDTRFVLQRRQEDAVSAIYVSAEQTAMSKGTPPTVDRVTFEGRGSSFDAQRIPRTWRFAIVGEMKHGAEHRSADIRGSVVLLDQHAERAEDQEENPAN